MTNQLGPLDWRIPLVTTDGRPTAEFQRRWATQIANNAQINGITFGAGPPSPVPAPADGAEYVDTSTTPYTLYVGEGGVWNEVGTPIPTVPIAANPTATAGPTAVNGVATTFMRSDAAPAIQKATSSQFGIVQVDGTTITEAAGIISASIPVVPTGANPTATAKDTAVNGSASTFMRSDAAPAIQKASSTQFGIVKVDGTTITESGGVISASGGGGGGTPGNPTATAGPTAINGVATTYMRSDAAPAVQLGSSSQPGILQVDGTTITESGGVISAVGGGGGSSIVQSEWVTAFTTANNSTSANACKGNIITITRNFTLRAVQCNVNSSGTYMIRVCVVNGGNQITSVLQDSPSLVSVSIRQSVLFTFTTPIALTAGQRIGVLLVRTDGTGAAACTTNVPANGGWENYAFTHVLGPVVADNDPNVGDTLSGLPSNAVVMNLLYVI